MPPKSKLQKKAVAKKAVAKPQSPDIQSDHDESDQSPSSDEMNKSVMNQSKPNQKVKKLERQLTYSSDHDDGDDDYGKHDTLPLSRNGEDDDDSEQSSANEGPAVASKATAKPNNVSSTANKVPAANAKSASNSAKDMPNLDSSKGSDDAKDELPTKDAKSSAANKAKPMRNGNANTSQQGDEDRSGGSGDEKAAVAPSKAKPKKAKGASGDEAAAAPPKTNKPKKVTVAKSTKNQSKSTGAGKATKKATKSKPSGDVKLKQPTKKPAQSTDQQANTSGSVAKGLVFNAKETVASMTKATAIFLAKRDRKTSMQKVKKYLAGHSVDVVGKQNAGKIRDTLKQMAKANEIVTVDGERFHVNKLFKTSKVQNTKSVVEAKAVVQKRKGVHNAEKKKRQMVSKVPRKENKRLPNKRLPRDESGSDSDGYDDDEDVPPHKRV